MRTNLLGLPCKHSFIKTTSSLSTSALGESLCRRANACLFATRLYRPARASGCSTLAAGDVGFAGTQARARAAKSLQLCSTVYGPHEINGNLAMACLPLFGYAAAHRYRAMCLLRKYCFGSGTVQFDVLSTSNAVGPDSWDKTEASANGKATQASALQDEGGVAGVDTIGHRTQAIAADPTPSTTQGMATCMFRFGLNYLNENVNVCMPIFAMHGNHGTYSLSYSSWPLPALHLLAHFLIV